MYERAPSGEEVAQQRAERLRLVEHAVVPALQDDVARPGDGVGDGAGGGPEPLAALVAGDVEAAGPAPMYQ